MSQLDGRRAMPTDREWREMQPEVRWEVALEILAESVLHENRDGRPLSWSVKSALWLAEDALGFKVARPGDAKAGVSGNTHTAQEDR